MELFIVMLVIFLQPEKAPPPIFVTGNPPRVDGMVIAPLAYVSQFVIVASLFDTEYVYIPNVADAAKVLGKLSQNIANTIAIIDDKVFLFILFLSLNKKMRQPKLTHKKRKLRLSPNIIK